MHNQVNCSARMVLNVNRDSMAQLGYSPPTRIFEAAGAGSCVVTDRWNGVDQFFTPDVEILTAGSAAEVVQHLRRIDDHKAREIADAMRARALRDHTYANRARQVDRLLMDQAARDFLTPTPLSAGLPRDFKAGENPS
jgi:spore maturation protein CgeB